MSQINLYSELSLPPSQIEEYTALIPPEIDLSICDASTVHWRFSGLLFKRLHLSDLSKIETWSQSTFKQPSLVYPQFEIWPTLESRAPATGITVGNAACVCICLDSETPDVPVDVVKRTTIHELARLARKLVGDFEGLDANQGQHCVSPSCLLNSTSGDHAGLDSVYGAIRERTTTLCPKCQSVWQQAFC